VQNGVNQKRHKPNTIGLQESDLLMTWQGALLPLCLLSTFSLCLMYTLGGILLMGLVYFLIFLSKKNRNMAEVIERNSPYCQIAEATGDIYFFVDTAGHIEWNRDVGVAFLGYEPETVDLQSVSFERWVYPSDLNNFLEAWQGLKEGRQLDMEVRLMRPNGRICWVHIFAMPSASYAAVGMMQNTQQLHEFREDISEARRLQTVGTMAGGIAHEFNNHLTPIRGFIELALDYLGPDHPVSEGLDTALNRVEYCTELVSQIQAYGRKSLLLPEPVDLLRLLPSVARLALSSHRESMHVKIRLEEEYPKTMPELLVDQGQFQQAMLQLIKNALESMPDGGLLKIRAESVYVHKSDVSEQKEARPGEFICIDVIDTGIGISPEILSQIFDPFFTTHKRAIKRGMGLPMVQGMVAQHGGWLEIRTQPGQGTDVRIFFPLKGNKGREEKAVIADEDGTMSVLPAAPLGRMLIGDDESLIRSLIRKVFESEGWDVEEATDFDVVINRIRTEDPMDLLVVDLTMSGPPAEEMVEEMMIKWPDTKLVIISGFGRDERVEDILKIADGEFVSKPFSPKDLLSTIDRLMAEKEQ